MAILKKESTEAENYKYKAPSEEELYAWFERLCEIFDTFLSSEKKDISKFTIDAFLIGESLVRIDKRRDYFIIFHEETKISELKEAALIAYWFMKFKPIKYIGDSEEPEYYEYINEKVAMFVILSAAKATCKKAGSDLKTTDFYIERLFYSLRYWCLNKSALILLSEALCAGVLSGEPKE